MKRRSASLAIVLVGGLVIAGLSAGVTATTTTESANAAGVSAISVQPHSTVFAVTAVGQVVPYTFDVQNPGNLELMTVTVEPRFLPPATGPGHADCPRATLAPGESMTCTADYTVTQADLDHGEIEMFAVAAGGTQTHP